MSKKHNISNISADTGRGKPVVLEKDEIVSRKHFLNDRTIGVSISESDNLKELGYGVPHLKDLIIEIARYILASGGKLAYGGDMRQGGFTETIFDLLAYYKADQKLQPHERFYSYLAYPLSTTLSAEREAELRLNVSFVKVLPPEDLQITNIKEFIKPDSIENQYIWARCLTKMREEMEHECSARIFVGGRAGGFRGICPGILEELLMAIDHKNPIYLVGAFGGIAKDVVEVLNGGLPKTFTNDHYLNDPEYQSLFTIYNQKNPDKIINYSSYFSKLKAMGFKGISDRNGLSEIENLRLANTPHITEIIYLIFKGLTNCFAK